MPTEYPELRTGSLVVLKSGGPLMTVEAIEYEQRFNTSTGLLDEVGIAAVGWFNNDGLQIDTFPIVCLVKH